MKELMLLKGCLWVAFFVSEIPKCLTCVQVLGRAGLPGTTTERVADTTQAVLIPHQPFRLQERAMTKFRSANSLQKFAAVHASIHIHFNQQRHLYSRKNFKLNRSAALAEWRQLAA
ncbi:MAG: hypothetical protein V3R56_00265 [Xanthomonadales bacterium]